MNILYESKDFLIVNKPSGMHSDEFMMHSIKKWLLCNRLDFETSGCLLFCCPELEPAMRALFSTHQGVQKLYLVGLSQDPGRFEEDFETIEGFIGSRYRSSKKVKFSLHPDDFRGYHSIRPVKHRVKVPKPVEIPSALQLPGVVHQVQLLSGARHQIRAYFGSLNSPVVGDTVYGFNPKTNSNEKPNPATIALHALSLRFEHPNFKGDIVFAEATTRASLAD